MSVKIGVDYGDGKDKTMVCISKEGSYFIIDGDDIPSLMRQMWDAGFRPEGVDFNFKNIYVQDVNYTAIKENLQCPPDVTLKTWCEMLVSAWYRLNEAEAEAGMKVEDMVQHLNVTTPPKEEPKSEKIEQVHIDFRTILSGDLSVPNKLNELIDAVNELRGAK